MTVGDSSGTYFVINRSGIYSIHAYFVGTSGGQPTAAIDVSSNIGHSSFANVIQLAYSAGVTSTGAALSVSYTGFLPSNANNYYKLKMTNISANSNSRLMITFLGESPNVPGFPY